jgi:hypothetical protein
MFVSQPIRPLSGNAGKRVKILSYAHWLVRSIRQSHSRLSLWGEWTPREIGRWTDSESKVHELYDGQITLVKRGYSALTAAVSAPLATC